VTAAYPPEARAKRVGAQVRVGATINVKGAVEDPKVLTSSATDKRFLAAFEEAALAAVRKTRYRPAKVNGQVVDMYVTTTVDFKVR
jgi:TonB family protein